MVFMMARAVVLSVLEGVIYGFYNGQGCDPDAFSLTWAGDGRVPEKFFFCRQE